jgi:hypothetical protein
MSSTQPRALAQGLHAQFARSAKETANRWDAQVPGGEKPECESGYVGRGHAAAAEDPRRKDGGHPERNRVCDVETASVQPGHAPTGPREYAPGHSEEQQSRGSDPDRRILPKSQFAQPFRGEEEKDSRPDERTAYEEERDGGESDAAFQPPLREGGGLLH